MHWAIPLSAATVIGLSTSVVVLIQHDQVRDDERKARAVSAQNAYVRMITGQSKPFPSYEAAYPGVRHLANFIEPALRKDDPVGALLKMHVPTREFTNVNHIIDMDVAYMPEETSNEEGGDTNPRTGESGDGELTSEFILLNVQALGDPPSAIKEVKAPRGQGVYTWRNVALLTAIPIVLYTVLVLPILFLLQELRDLRKRRKHRQWLASLTQEAREIYRIRERLELNKPSVEKDRYGYKSYNKLNTWMASTEGKAWKKADEAFTLATDGWTNTEHDAELARLTTELNDLVQAIRTGQQTYKEL